MFNLNHIIRVEQSFILYANCKVLYDGRAKSTLKPGNYLITHKNDGTLKIDGGELCNPLNYQPPQALLKLEQNNLISVRKKETITIELIEVHFYKELKDWSNNKIEITKTEQQLRDKMLDIIDDILKINSVEVFKEFKTPVGNLDILAIDENGVYHIVEVKRNKASLSACSQLERYVKYFNDIKKETKGYLASPEISKNALAYSINNSQEYLKIDHSILNK